MNNVQELSITDIISDIQLVDSSYNYPGNYKNYTLSTLLSIIKIWKRLRKNNINNTTLQEFSEKNKLKNKQILLLDLDETLIHTDFQKTLSNYDTIINFKVKLNDVNIIDNTEYIEYNVGTFIRTGLYDFLNNLYEKFDLYIFTASIKEYADTIIDYIERDKKYFKKRFYRDDCINISNKIFIKDLSILNKKYKNFFDLSNIIIVDNSMYSFMNNISNGILITSFYNNKNDYELYNVLNYLLYYVYNADDVRIVNDTTFNFKGIIKEIECSLNA